jgi:hypothetical protein
MANQDIQKESPGSIWKEPPRAPTPPEPPDNDNRFRRPEPVSNLTARIALYLGFFSAFPTLMGLFAMWGYVRHWLGYSYPNWEGGNSWWYLGAFLWCWLLGPPLGLAALLFGILGFLYHKRHATAGGRGHAIFAIWLGLVALIAALVSFLSILLWMPDGFRMYP